MITTPSTKILQLIVDKCNAPIDRFLSSLAIKTTHDVSFIELSSLEEINKVLLPYLMPCDFARKSRSNAEALDQVCAIVLDKPANHEECQNLQASGFELTARLMRVKCHRAGESLQEQTFPHLSIGFEKRHALPKAGNDFIEILSCKFNLGSSLLIDFDGAFFSQKDFQTVDASVSLTPFVEYETYIKNTQSNKLTLSDIFQQFQDARHALLSRKDDKEILVLLYHLINTDKVSIKQIDDKWIETVLAEPKMLALQAALENMEELGVRIQIIDIYPIFSRTATVNWQLVYKIHFNGEKALSTPFYPYMEELNKHDLFRQAMQNGLLNNVSPNDEYAYLNITFKLIEEQQFKIDVQLGRTHWYYDTIVETLFKNKSEVPNAVKNAIIEHLNSCESVVQQNTDLCNAFTQVIFNARTSEQHFNKLIAENENQTVTLNQWLQDTYYVCNDGAFDNVLDKTLCGNSAKVDYSEMCVQIGQRSIGLYVLNNLNVNMNLFGDLPFK